MNIQFLEVTYWGENGWHGYETGQKYLVVVRFHKRWFRKMFGVECWRVKGARWHNGYYDYRSMGTFLSDFDIEKAV